MYNHVNPFVFSGGPDSLLRRPFLWTLVLHPSMRARWATLHDSSLKMLYVCFFKAGLLSDICPHLFIFMSGEDVHAEESFFFSGFCRDSNPLPVPCPPGSSGPINQMVRCQEIFDIAEIIQLKLFLCLGYSIAWNIVPCCSSTFL